MLKFIDERPLWVSIPWILMVVEGIFTTGLIHGWWASEYFNVQHEDLVFKIDMLMAFIVEGLWHVKKTIKGEE